MMNKKKTAVGILIVLVGVIIIGCSAAEFNHQKIKTAVEGRGKIKKIPDLEDYNSGEKVKFTAQPAEGWVFYGWSGDLEGTKKTKTLVTGENMYVKAQFIPEAEIFEIKTSVEGKGKIKVTPEKERYRKGEEVKLTAEPKSDWTLHYWDKDLEGRKQTKKVVVTDNMEIRAKFISLQEEVDFKDPVLEQMIKDKVGKEKLTVDDVKDIKVLDAYERGIEGIESLEGVEYLLNLEEFIISCNQVKDLNPLIDLGKIETLETFHFFNNQVEDISPVAELEGLKSLQFGFNEVSDISPLGQLKNLKVLSILQNNIEDLQPLANLTNLEVLLLGGNKDKVNNEDLEIISNLTNLKSLKLGSSEVDDISPLVNLTDLRILEFNNSNLSDISPLGDSTKLEELSLHGNSIEDITPLTNLANLEELNLSDNNISDISCLPDLNNLKEVDLKNNPLDTTEGSEAVNTIKELESKGVKVDY